ncbi:MAG: Nramp family divalent metal transporter [Bacteroidota bacterium]
MSEIDAVQDTKSDWINRIKMLGPGLLFAGAAIGVSHLVQSTKAGAEYGLALLWAVILAHIFKYPFFEFGPRYASATGESLIQGYRKLGNWVLVLFIVMTIGTMFTVQSAVTIVTAGLATKLFGLTGNAIIWVAILLGVCVLILTVGRYSVLDKTMKAVIVILTISTLLALFFAFGKGFHADVSLAQTFPLEGAGLAFLIALMGWLPAPIDLSVWHSLWAIEKDKTTKEQFTSKKALFDFNVGYWGTFCLALSFLLLGAIVMFGTGEKFSPQGGIFAGQLITLYTSSLGEGAKMIIGLAAFTTMFSTTLTCLDALPRTMAAATAVFQQPSVDPDSPESLDTPMEFDDRTGETTAHEFMTVPRKYYWFWMAILVVGTIVILGTLVSSMGVMVKIATILSFLTAPFFAIFNYRLVTSQHMPEALRPGKRLRWLSFAGMVFLIGFGLLYLASLAGLVG